VSDKGVSVKLNADESGFVKAVKNSEESLEDLQKGLDDLTKDGADNVDKLEEKFSDTIKSVKDLGDASESSLRKTKRGADDAGDGMQDLKREANSTAKEAAASFDGSAESIVDAFQEVAAQAFEGFGPAGAIAGLAAAAGIGLAMSAFSDFQEQQKRMAELAAELGEQYIESGHVGADAIQNIVDKLKEMATTSDESAISLRDVEYAAKNIEEQFGELAQAYAGGQEDLADYIQKLKDKEQAEKDAAENANETEGRYFGEKKSRYEETINSLEEVQEAQEKAAESERLANEAGLPALQAKAEAIAGINAAYDNTVNSITDYVDAESGILDVDAYLAAIEARRQALVDYQNNLVAANLTDEQKSALNAMGQEAAAVWLEAYVSPNTTDDQKRKLSASLTEASKEASGAAKSTLDKEFSDGVTTKLNLDTSDAIAKADSDIRNWAPDEKALTLRLNIVDRYGQPIP
jgi:hypothetical protein